MRPYSYGAGPPLLRDVEPSQRAALALLGAVSNKVKPTFVLEAALFFWGAPCRLHGATMQDAQTCGWLRQQQVPARAGTVGANCTGLYRKGHRTNVLRLTSACPVHVQTLKTQRLQ
jgi:hypothetical protein